MKLATRFPFTTLVVLLAASLWTPLDAQAHPWSNWYPARWGSGNGGSIDWRFVSNVPTGGGLRNAVKAGAQEWNDVNTSMSFHFQSDKPDYDAFNPAVCADTAQKDAVRWAQIDGANGVLARTWLCTYAEAGGSTDGASLWDFEISIDNQENWHEDPTTVPGPNQYDLYSAMTHEFGHSTGRDATMTQSTAEGDGAGHFLSSSIYCNTSTSDYHTMCPITYVNTIWERSLNTHDIDTFQNAYS